MEAKEKERVFHDHVYTSNVRDRVSKFYSVTRSSRAFYKNFLLARCKGKRVLEYGCGEGSYALLLAQHGAKVTGIDISPVAIQYSREQAQKKCISDIEFLIMDAEKMDYPNNTFDIVCGTGILHH
ncbi:class I SAM-dependent methyltransferase, partial [candidate division KSB1 bacterium]|nr:class I SAM-dependent methyltransferase [candidate division KSB1 bacterium]